MRFLARYLLSMVGLGFVGYGFMLDYPMELEALGDTLLSLPERSSEELFAVTMIGAMALLLPYLIILPKSHVTRLK